MSIPRSSKVPGIFIFFRFILLEYIFGMGLHSFSELFAEIPQLAAGSFTIKDAENTGN
jgi:hypothetical protein